MSEFINHFNTLYTQFESAEVDYLHENTDNDVALNAIKNHITACFPCVMEQHELTEELIFTKLRNTLEFCYYLDLNVDNIVSHLENSNADYSFIDLSDEIEYEEKQVQKTILKHPEAIVYNTIYISFFIPILENIALLIRNGNEIIGAEFPERFKNFINA